MIKTSLKIAYITDSLQILPIDPKITEKKKSKVIYYIGRFELHQNHQKAVGFFFLITMKNNLYLIDFSLFVEWDHVN